MKVTLPCTLLMTALSFYVKAQDSCQVGQDQIIHDLNTTQVALRNDGIVVTHSKADGLTADLQLNLWLTGSDPNGYLVLAKHADSNDFVAGLADYYNNCLPITTMHHIPSEDLVTYRDLLASAQTTNEDIDCSAIPESILTYPAYGNPFLQDSLVGELTRAYFDDQALPGDIFGNGIYDPCEGDHPIAIPFCSWNHRSPHVLNQRISQITISSVTTAYGFNAIMMHFTIKPKCSQPIHLVVLRINSQAGVDLRDAGISLFAPLKEGQAMAYVPDIHGYTIYDQSPEEGATISSLSYLYGSDVPRTFLRDSLGHRLYDDEGQPIYDPHPPFGFGRPDTLIPLNQFSSFFPIYKPLEDLDADNYLQFQKATFEDGTPLTFGSSGYDTTSTDLTNYAFEGLPYDDQTWTSADLANDEQPVGTLLNIYQHMILPGDIVDHVFLLRSGKIDHRQPQESAQQYISDTKVFMEEILPYCEADDCSLTEVDKTAPKTGLKVYPNPAHHTLIVDASEHASYLVINLTGQTVQEGHLIDQQINIAALPTGVYLLQIVDDASVQARKFIKD